MPSEWYEGFPMVLVESFAHGLPVIASRLGAMAEIVEDGRTGLHFDPGCAEDLAQKVEWLEAHQKECRQMGENALQVYEEKYSPEKNYSTLQDIYNEVIEEKKKSLNRKL
jgi:glycosyltransferase involved in cell wall biosynthesis